MQTRGFFRNAVLLAVLSAMLPIGTGSAKASGDFAPLYILVKRQSATIDRILPYVERQDIPKLAFLKQTSRKLLESIIARGQANMETLQNLQEMLIAYRFSVNVFQTVRTVRTSQYIEDLQSVTRQISDLSGFDQSPYTKITFGVFQRLRVLTLSLTELPIQQTLAEKLRDLQPQIGRVLAAASQGDHRLTLQAGEECLAKIVALYPAFNEISISDMAFNSVMEIQGIGEFYADFIKADDPLDPRKTQGDGK